MTRDQEKLIDTLIRRLRTVEELLDRRGFAAHGLVLPVLALRAKDAARALGVSPRTLYAWTASAKIPHVRQDGVVLYPVAQLRRWLSDLVCGARALQITERDQPPPSHVPLGAVTEPQVEGGP